MIESLYSRIGGDETLRAAVEIFYDKVLADHRIARHFREIDITGQKAKQRAFLSYVLGGPVLYSGREMRAAHAHLGLGEEDYRAFEEHLRSTLQELEIEDGLIKDVLAIAARHHDDVLNL